MITLEDGYKGNNFLTEDIFQQALERFPLSEKKEKSVRLYHNLLGSQTMCFNLFSPLIGKEISSKLFCLLPGSPDVVNVTNILFEYAPTKEDHLNDRTAFDAFLEYSYSDGKKGFIGIETKLSEPFSQKNYQFSDNYDRWITKGNWWWKPGAEKRFSNKTFNQLWRNQLLVYAMLHQDNPKYQEGFCAVVYPLSDTACGEAIQEYQQLLLPEGSKTLLVWPLELIADKWMGPLMEDPPLNEWFEKFRTRYLDLKLSQDAWQKFRGENDGEN